MWYISTFIYRRTYIITASDVDKFNFRLKFEEMKSSRKYKPNSCPNSSMKPLTGRLLRTNASTYRYVLTRRATVIRCTELKLVTYARVNTKRTDWPFGGDDFITPSNTRRYTQNTNEESRKSFLYCVTRRKSTVFIRK